jgi:hypothetical protein
MRLRHRHKRSSGPQQDFLSLLEEVTAHLASLMHRARACHIDDDLTSFKEIAYKVKRGHALLRNLHVAKVLQDSNLCAAAIEDLREWMGHEDL